MIRKKNIELILLSSLHRIFPQLLARPGYGFIKCSVGKNKIPYDKIPLKKFEIKYKTIY